MAKPIQVALKYYRNNPPEDDGISVGHIVCNDEPKVAPDPIPCINCGESVRGQLCSRPVRRISQHSSCLFESVIPRHYCRNCAIWTWNGGKVWHYMGEEIHFSVTRKSMIFKLKEEAHEDQ